jgi:hypothetical protein
MFCPQCREEFPWHVMVCPTCDVDTVDRLPGPEPAPDVELVRVLASGDAGLIAIARSLLEGAEIDYFVRGDGLQDLFGLGRITGFSYAMGPAEFWVREDDAVRARELLEDLTASGPPTSTGNE